MSSPEQKMKKRKRLQNNKRHYKPRSPQAKDLATPKYHQRVIQDKRGKDVDLEKLSHADLVRAIQDDT